MAESVQPPTGKYPAKQHVAKVIAEMRKQVPAINGVLYLEGQKSRMLEDSDQPAPFRQRRHFYYLTGCELADCSFTYDIPSSKSTLFIPPPDPEDVMWSGLPLNPDQALERYDVDEVQTTPSVNGHLASSGLDKSNIWAIADQVSDQTTFLAYEKKDFGVLKSAIDESRIVKSEYEVELIAYANQVSSRAHQLLLQTAQSADNERDLYATFTQHCISRGCPKQAYDSIVAGGRNAATLHYIQNTEPLAGRSTVLIDAGAEYRCYAADITRVIPLQNGKFTAQSRAIYGIVLDMQETALGMLRADVLWDDVQLAAHRRLVKGLLKIGLFTDTEREEDIIDARTSAAFYPHGLGHFLGLDTHDTGGRPDHHDQDPFFTYLRIRRRIPEGSVVTVEPGCYFSRFIIEPYLNDPKHAKFIDRAVLDQYWDVGGVRIEDNVLITKTGYRNLTTAPKAIDEIERLAQS